MAGINCQQPRITLTRNQLAVSVLRAKIILKKEPRFITQSTGVPQITIYKNYLRDRFLNPPIATKPNNIKAIVEGSGIT